MRRNECFRFGGIWEVYGEITRRGGIAAERMSARRNGCLRFRENMGSVEMVTRRRDARTRRERITRAGNVPLIPRGRIMRIPSREFYFIVQPGMAVKMLAAEEGVSPREAFRQGR